MNSTSPVLEARGLVKLFGRVVGLAGVDLKLYRGEVLAIIGDNGAGKSTLIKCLSGGQRQAVAVARAGAFGGKVVILDEPTAALGVRETGQVLRLVREMRDQGLGVILISHNMPNVFEVADRIHIQRLGSAVGVIDPKTSTMEDAVAYMTGARRMDPSINLAATG